MTPPSTKQNTIWLLAPVLGTAVFVVLYFVATTYYPGGSQVDEKATGFSWINNYWCNLLNEYAINGHYNHARPIAMAGLVMLCLTLLLFWFLFAQHIKMGNIHRLVIQVSAAIAMTITILLLTKMDHDLITNLASLFGLIATVATIIGLFKIRWYFLFVGGLLNLVLVGVNSYLYYDKALIIYLPIIQKIGFAVFLLWICSISICLYQQKISKKYLQQPFN